VTADIVEDGFGPDENGDPQGECYIRFDVDQNGLFKAMKTLYDELIGGPFDDDDDSYDYWPSGVLLLQAIGLRIVGSFAWQRNRHPIGAVLSVRRVNERSDE